MADLPLPNSEPDSVLRIFLNGLAVVLPIALTVAFVVWLGTSLEHLLGGLLRTVMPESYYKPGLGIAAGIALIFAVGLAMRLWLARKLIEIGIAVIERIPLANTVYTTVRDVIRFIQSASEPDETSKVVLVDLGNGMKVVGFVTDESSSLAGAGENGRVPVYLQMSYQLGGYTVFIERDRLEALDVPLEDAMRWVISAGITGDSGDRGKDGGIGTDRD